MTLILSYNQYWAYVSFCAERKTETPKYIVYRITANNGPVKYHFTFEDEEEMMFLN